MDVVHGIMRTVSVSSGSDSLGATDIYQAMKDTRKKTSLAKCCVQGHGSTEIALLPSRSLYGGTAARKVGVELYYAGESPQTTTS